MLHTTIHVKFANWLVENELSEINSHVLISRNLELAPKTVPTIGWPILTR